jgi:hypothetical protein
MSELTQFSPARPPDIPRWFHPWSFLAGLAGALVLLAVTGVWLGRHDRHPDFTRFHPLISPEGNYYPTIAEMCAIVRARCRPDQVLVIVGGNSIFYGVGQPPAKMWTRRLQELLGERYCVINFAFRGSSASDGGALVAEVLRAEFPRQIYVANMGPLQGINPMGSLPYRFIFWEAYYKGLLAEYAPRTNYVRLDFQNDPIDRRAHLEIVGRVWLDRLLHFRDVWNWVAMEWFCTVPSSLRPDPAEVTWPRRRFADTEPDFMDIPFEKRFRSELLDTELGIVRGFTESFYQRTGDGHWQLSGLKPKEFGTFIRIAMPELLRRRTLLVVSKNSPYYVDQLAPGERERDEQAYRDSLEIWRGAGYHAMTYPDGFDAADYGDRTHLTVAGGRKLAATVADNVRAIAAECGYGSAP